MSQTLSKGQEAPRDEPMDVALPGDKVRIKVQPHVGERGVVRDLDNADLVVELDKGEVVIVEVRAATNYSLAARKAWQTMPHRRVGRPRTGRSDKRKTVSLRVDTELWRLFGEAADAGVIQSREQAINAWISVFVSKYLPGRESSTEKPAEAPGAASDNAGT